MGITAVVPVREGSRRLKNKNVAPFAGTNLLINKLNQLKQVKEIETIVASSDCISFGYNFSCWSLFESSRSSRIFFTSIHLEILEKWIAQYTVFSSWCF